jgi:hypothetical protein
MTKIIHLTTLCLSLATGTSFAQNYGGGSGTESDPFRISSRIDLEKLTATVNNGTAYAGFYFRLTADLTGITTVIGDRETTPFCGVFDGDGHATGLDINLNGDCAGVFGYISGATVKNMKVSGRIVLGSSSRAPCAGGICGNATNSTVVNCHNTGSISILASTAATYDSSVFSHAGGICGATANSTVSGCYNTGSISITTSSSYHTYVGGICGSGGTVGYCHNTGNISARSVLPSYAGGICGNGGTIGNCYNTGSISSASTVASAGGICGDEGTVGNCYNTGSVSATSYFYTYAGGICGHGNNIRNCYNTGDISSEATTRASCAGGICGVVGMGRSNISNCFVADVTVTASLGDEFAGRIVGRGDISNCHASTSMKLNGREISSTNAGSKDGTDGESANFKNESWLTSVLAWDFETVWTVSGPPGSGWPLLKGPDEPSGNGAPERPLPAEVVLYPNPATHDVYIRSDRPASKVEIYNSAGLCVLRTGHFTGKADVSRLESGIYTVRIYTSPVPQTKRLVIRK